MMGRLRKTRRPADWTHYLLALEDGGKARQPEDEVAGLIPPEDGGGRSFRLVRSRLRRSWSWTSRLTIRTLSGTFCLLVNVFLIILLLIMLHAIATAPLHTHLRGRFTQEEVEEFFQHQESISRLIEENKHLYGNKPQRCTYYSGYRLCAAEDELHDLPGPEASPVDAS